ncbi:PREDICTED: uncharacterized protein LOC105458298 [Wasmannia auropunctata]|uniref:uncharacterized protein LOC105458298 n=1 Tax=Wasmannia auropunctata TaxID=64793 RepID=UPI0005F095C3|nr:PREDICTED: uncharacterized protein LOC105458298 [Wasmannia auropunctata]
MASKYYTNFRQDDSGMNKRHFREIEIPVEKLKRKADDEEEGHLTKTTVNSIKMSKQKRLAVLNNVKQDEAKLDPNIVGFESSHSSDEDDSNEEEESEAQVPASNVVINEKKDKRITKESKKSVEEVQQRNVAPKVRLLFLYL